MVKHGLDRAKRRDPILHPQWRIQGGGGAPPPPPPPPTLVLLIIYAKYSVLNCILNVQLPKASALRAGGAYPPPAPPPFGEPRHFSLPPLLPPPPPPLSKFLILVRSVSARAPSSKIGSHGIHINDHLNGPKTP